MARNLIVCAMAAALLVLAACSGRDGRCDALPNPRECARVLRAGGQFEDYRRNGLAGYTLSRLDPPRLHRPGSSVFGRIGSYESAIRRYESRRISKRADRQRREVRRAVKRSRAGTARQR